MTTSYCSVLDVSRFMGLKRDTPRDLNADANSGQNEIDVGASVVHFNSGTKIIIYDDDNPTGEELTVSSISGTKLVCSSNLSNNYTVLANGKVENQSHFTPRTVPSHTDVEDIINMVEDEIDRDIHTSYRTVGERIEEFVTIMLGRDKSFPYYSQPLSYSSNWRYPIRLDNRNILPFDRTKGDYIRVQIGGDWKDLLDPVNGYTVWESIVDEIVDSEDLSASSPITCTLAMQPRLASKLKWNLTHANITEFSLKIEGTDQAGNSISETFTEADGWYGYTTNFFNTVTAVTFTRTTGTGTGDTLDVTTERQESRESSNYDLWVDYDQGVIYPITIAIDTGHKTVRVGYRRGHYRKEYSSIPGDIKKACILLTASDLLINERYALNLPRANVSTIDVEKTLQHWKSKANKILSRRREIVGGVYYQ